MRTTSCPLQSKAFFIFYQKPSLENLTISSLFSIYLWFGFILIIIIGNKEFLRVCSFAQTGPYASLTIFDFVLPSMLPQLHLIFLKALHEDFPQEKDTESNREYLTLTVPCVDLNESDSSYYITVSNI